MTAATLVPSVAEARQRLAALTGAYRRHLEACPFCGLNIRCPEERRLDADCDAAAWALGLAREGVR